MQSPKRRPAAQLHALCLLVLVPGYFLPAALGCTVIELQGSGFASNAVHLLHAVPIYDGNNGTLFVDNSAFTYQCEEGGGWHDFFATEVWDARTT